MINWSVAVLGFVVLAVASGTSYITYREKGSYFIVFLITTLFLGVLGMIIIDYAGVGHY